MIRKAVPESHTLSALKADMAACRYCEDEGILPAANPVFQIPEHARIGLFGQAPGNLAHLAGRPFADPSGVRLREWLGVTEAEFYDSGHFAVVPMAFCFPGYDGKSKTGKGGDLPPPKVCAERWRAQVMAQILDQMELVLLVGRYSIEWHLPEAKGRPLTELVKEWPAHFAHAEKGGPIYLPIPHPSWRNNAWLKKNPWFEEELVPRIKKIVRKGLKS